MRDFNGLKGRLVSAGGPVTAGTGALIISVPANQAFVLTQACFAAVSADAIVAGQLDGFSGVDSRLVVHGPGCTEVVPGLAFAKGTPVSCYSPAGGASTVCMITGVLVEE